MNSHIKTINNIISFLPSSESPLSADVYAIKGDDYTYVIDVGSCDEAFEFINSIEKKKIIITHFHDDHMKNLKRLSIPESDLFLGDHAGKIFESKVYSEDAPRRGTIVKSPMSIEDGISLTICPIPSSHAKGSLCVIVNDEYLLIGDAFYCSAKGYNVSLLADEIRCLKELSFTKVIMSHDEKIYSREESISELEGIYGRRSKDDPYVSI
jgi:glyoxylase-like metal-dependent hydrolase (beta-lactamase superfamily II)